MIDTSGIIPDLRAVAEQVAQVYVHHAGDDFVGLIAHGSAVKGGFIAGCSDVDFQLYVRDGALTTEGHLPLDRSIALHSDLARINPAPALYIQCYAFGSKLRDGWAGPIPGTYRVLAGRLPVSEATADELRASAVMSLASIGGTPAYLRDGLLDHGEDRLARRVRLLCTDVWPTLYNLIIVQGVEPITAWNLTKSEAIERLDASSEVARLIRSFDQSIHAYFPRRAAAPDALDAITVGVAFLQVARRSVSPV